ncbi:sodium/hydrogen exchanger 9B2-like [Oryzias melastigma]|uniref:sodium/hydrogen exchanger 9B2-like n=1 Tax=Oryzias melastigma TaxID=30732 RepID=UPI000CF832CB|nr:sodium/hydrogen exchanger 9B2-like [Oryzias melastigma]
MAREQEDATLIKFGLDVLTLAVLAILTTAPVGALGIGLAGPRLLARQIKEEADSEAGPSGPTEPVQEKGSRSPESRL